jgi:hypothetical protein
VTDPFNIGANYGPQYYDYKFLYNLNMYYEVPVYKTQQGVLGHILGGWTISPLFTTQSGGVTAVGYSEGSCTACEAFGEVTTPGTSAVSSPLRKTPLGTALHGWHLGALRCLPAAPAPT